MPNTVSRLLGFRVEERRAVHQKSALHARAHKPRVPPRIPRVEYRGRGGKARRTGGGQGRGSWAGMDTREDEDGEKREPEERNIRRIDSHTFI